MSVTVFLLRTALICLIAYMLLRLIKKKLENGTKKKFHFEGLPLPLIINGKVQDQNLNKIDKTRFWLKNQIQEKGAADFKEVFFCSVDYRGALFVDKKRKEDIP